jgi:predicted regulator of Ras-like GTPase activity (Roadblock/LC7/MglB family)
MTREEGAKAWGKLRDAALKAKPGMTGQEFRLQVENKAILMGLLTDKESASMEDLLKAASKVVNELLNGVREPKAQPGKVIAFPAPATLPLPMDSAEEPPMATEPPPGMAEEPAAPLPQAAQAAPPVLKNAIGKKVLPITSSNLVYCSVGVRSGGNVQYKHLEQDSSEEVHDDGVRDTQETKLVQKSVQNVDELEAANKVRGRIWGRLKGVGTMFSKGVILVPVDKMDGFYTADREIAEWIEDHNRDARDHKVVATIFPMVVMTTKEDEVAKRLAYDFQDILGQMKTALEQLDEKKLGQLATELKAKATVALPAGLEQGAILAAVQDARRQAGQIRKAAKGKQEEIQQVKKSVDTKAIQSARMLFLEFAQPTDAAPAAPALPITQDAAATRLANLEAVMARD